MSIVRNVKWSVLLLGALTTGVVSSAPPAGELRQVPPVVPKTAAQITALAQQLCAPCHSIDGRGVSAEFPSLAGQQSDYIVKQLFAFKTGQRENPFMKEVIRDLTADDARRLAEHFSRLPPTVQRVADPDAAQRGARLYAQGRAESGVASCASCHGERALGGAQMPRLAGQGKVYLLRRMNTFSGAVQSGADTMHSGVPALSERDLMDLAEHLSAVAS